MPTQKERDKMQTQLKKIRKSRSLKEVLEKQVADGSWDTKSINWDIDVIQFPRLISELQACGAITRRVMAALCHSMDLKPRDLEDLLERARTKWDQIRANTNPPRSQTMVEAFYRNYGKRKGSK
jgi:hypothetical protein